MARRTTVLAAALAATLLSAPIARAQAPTPAPGAAVEADALGRETPRGTVVGFMDSAGKGNLDVAGSYLNTSAREHDAATLAHQLYVVLDARLPARLRDLSDRPEGSLANPLKRNQDVVGVIATDDGQLDIVVERVNRNGQLVWLFSRQTLEVVPAVYQDIDLVAVETHLPIALTRPKIAGIRLFNWLALLALPLLYYGIGLLAMPFGRALTAWRRRPSARPARVPGPVRLFALAGVIRWLEWTFELQLFEREFWSAIVAILFTAAFVWIALVVNEYGERRIGRRFTGARYGEIAGLLRLGRRAADVIVVAAGLLIALRYFGVDPTAALAGLGIGGIAVALSAQKTLENVIGGLSIIMDQAVRVGDFMKVGDILGSVEFIGLRSTRVRTLDRTILTVPNGQLATINVETLSVRDKFWFHHTVGLGYETTAAQMRAVIDGVRSYLAAHPHIDGTETVRVRFFRFGPFSLDIELFAYVNARDWEEFLETQQELMLGAMEIVARAGASIALPSQRLQVVDAGRSGAAARLST